MLLLHETGGGVSFAIKVHPRARRNAIEGVIGEALKISLVAPPTDGKANEACVRFLSQILNVPRSAVNLVSGESSRNKVIRIDGMTSAELRRRLPGAHEQEISNP